MDKEGVINFIKDSNFRLLTKKGVAIFENRVNGRDIVVNIKGNEEWSEVLYTYSKYFGNGPHQNLYYYFKINCEDGVLYFLSECRRKPKQINTINENYIRYSIINCYDLLPH